MSQMELPDRTTPGLAAGIPWWNPDAADAISAFVDRGPFGVAVIDTDLRILLVSPVLAALHGLDVAGTVGRRVDEVVPHPYGDRLIRRLRQVLSSGTSLTQAESWGTLTEPNARRSFSSSFYRLDAASGSPLGVVVLVTETTELRGAVTAFKAAELPLRLLERITDALSASLDAAGVMEVALTGALQAMEASAAALMVCDSNSDKLVPVAFAGLNDATLARLHEPSDLGTRLPHCDVVRTQSVKLWGSRAERDAEYPELTMYSTDHQAWAFVPMLAKDVVLGVLLFAWRLDRSFADADVDLLHALGHQCALALEQARILDAERESRRAMEFLVEVTKFVVESSDEGVIAISNGNRILSFNRRFCELMGLPETAIEVGNDARFLVEHCTSLAAHPDAVTRHLAAGRERPFDLLEADFELKDGRVLAYRTSPIVDRRNVALGRLWYLRDETRLRVQDTVQRAAMEQLQASHEHQAFLLEAAEIIAQAEGYRETLERLAAVAVPTLADLCLVDTLTWDGRIVRMAAKHSDPALQPLVDELGSNYAPDPAGQHPSIEVIHAGRVRWSTTMSDDFLRQTTRDDHHFELLKLLNFTSFMALPLIADNRILGSITLVSAGSGRRFGPAAVALAEDFTSYVAQVVAPAHRNDAARHAAQTLQDSLLPDHVPRVPGLEIAVRYLPATLDADVGGDFYDIIPGGSGRTTVVIGDVAGHDMQAAAVMGKVRTAVRVLANQANGPKHMVEMLRDGWDDLDLERMVTLIVATVDVPGGELRIVSVGHPRPLLVTADHATFLEVDPTSPLGAPASPINQWQGLLEPDTALLLYTDGLIEDQHQNFDAGASRLIAAATERSRPEALCDEVLSAMVLDRLHHDDDIALVAVVRSAARS
jgi:PAS domain-containing protein